MSELTTPAVAVLAEESGAAAFRLDEARPVTGWGVLSGPQIWIWAMGLRALQPGAAGDPFTYEAWVADRAGMLRSLGAVGPAPGGTALATFGLEGDPAAAAGLVVTAQARGATRPTAVVLTGRVQRAEPAADVAAAPDTPAEPAVEPAPGGAAAAAETGLTDGAEAPEAQRPAGPPEAPPNGMPDWTAPPAGAGGWQGIGPLQPLNGAAPPPAAAAPTAASAYHPAAPTAETASPPAAPAAPKAASAPPPATFAAPLAGSDPASAGPADPFGMAAGPGAEETAPQPWPPWPGAPAAGAAPLLRPLSGGSPGSAPPEPLTAAPPEPGPHIPRDPTGAALHGYPAWNSPFGPMGPEAAAGAGPAPAFGPSGVSFMPGAAPAELPTDPEPGAWPPPGAMPGAADAPAPAAGRATADAPATAAAPAMADAPAAAGDLPPCPPGHVPAERAAVALEPQGPLYSQGSGSAQLDFAEGGLLVTLRGMPPVDAVGQSGHTGRPYNAYRVWLQVGGTRQILPAGIASRVWTDTWRLQVRDGLPLRRYDTVLVTAEDRAGSSAFPAGPVLLAGHYRWYRPGP